MHIVKRQQVQDLTVNCLRDLPFSNLSHNALQEDKRCFLLTVTFTRHCVFEMVTNLDQNSYAHFYSCPVQPVEI